ncbi:sensor histidine kinase [Natronorubrum sp. FCH18a]|uniref:sensor histidine kinase n=1 Tax=Natronorubrum sp. FCH18a TaxID=3447018 RepID=UPI003F518EB1
MHVCWFVPGALETGEHARSLERANHGLTITVVDATSGEDWTRTESVDCVLYHDGVSSIGIETIRSVWPTVPFVYVVGNGADEFGTDVLAELRPADDWVDERRLVADPALVATRLRRTVERAREIEKLRDRAAHFSGLIENASDVVTVLDENGIVRYQSPSIREVLGYDQEELVGEYTFDYIHPDDVEDAAEVFSEAATSEEPHTGRAVFRYRHKDGSWVHFEAVGQYLPSDADDAESNGREYVVISRDITEIRETTEELHSTRDQLQVILDNTPAVVYMKDLEQRYLYVNPAFEQLFEQSRDEILGKRSEDIHPDVNVEQINEMDREVLSERESNKYVEDFRIDGKRRVFFNVRAPLFDADGDPYAIYGIATEITERKEREESMQALAEAGPRLLECETMESVGSVAVSVAKSVLNQPITAILVPDERDDVLRPIVMTDEATDLLGDSTTTTWGSGIAGRVFSTGDRHASGDVSTDSTADRSDTPIESEIIVPLGEHGVLFAGSTETREFDEHDLEFATILGAMIQGTIDRVDRERQLQTKNQRLEEFSNVLAHDLRNPLAVAKGYVELARETGNLDHLTDVEEGVERAMSIMDGLLALARTGQGITDFEEGALERLATEAWSSIETRDASLRVETDRPITADLGWLQQLFENAFRNAVEHGGSGVSVRVGAIDGGFYIADDGPGIDPERRDRLLEGDSADGDVRFGFKIIQDVVDAHGWELSIGESDEGGAKFEIVGVR